MSYQANELIRGTNSIVYYTDFYNAYNNYLIYMKEYIEDERSLSADVDKFPGIMSPLNTIHLVSLPVLAMLTWVLSPFYISVIFYGAVPSFAVLAILFWRMNTNKWRLGEIVNLSDRLKQKLMDETA